ncbi:uncharacterized protein LOC121404998 [Drosophila obscura]|uniref:uncharacterized protein LOC121404998 n=1 Tax=Drosophila obscura TaxID=7282 RepID=UPI001BB295BC|nr:uncharacterized protein LOC121404998 [Drosophila obscura]
MTNVAQQRPACCKTERAAKKTDHRSDQPGNRPADQPTDQPINLMVTVAESGSGWGFGSSESASGSLLHTRSTRTRSLRLGPKLLRARRQMETSYKSTFIPSRRVRRTVCARVGFIRLSAHSWQAAVAKLINQRPTGQPTAAKPPSIEASKYQPYKQILLAVTPANSSKKNRIGRSNI